MGLFAGMRQFKTAHHVHTTNSDGDDPVWSVVEEHYRKGYDVLAITDHNTLTHDWVTATRGITRERLAEITAGLGRDGRPMLMIPDTNEQSRHEHVNTYFVQYQAPASFAMTPDDPHFVSHGRPMEYRGIPEQYTLSNIRRTLEETQTQDGLAQINHIGRYTLAGMSPFPQAPSNDPATIAKYVNLFTDFSTCVGMSIINKKDDESRNDRILWDNINKFRVPQGRTVWGFSNDDTHFNRDTGYSYNVFVMPENTLAEFRTAMTSGRFYAVAKVARMEAVNSQDLSVPPPVIRDIEVTGTSITITAENYSRIDWIAEGTATVAQGVTINKAGVSGSFVRANVIGPGGVAFTQPFRV